MINKCTELIEEHLVEKAKKLGVALLCDGLKNAKIEFPNYGCLEASISPVERGMVMAGTALTIETDKGDNFPIHVGMYCTDQPGYVLVIDGKAHQGKAYLGDLIIGACKAIGFSGIVVDGYTRDRDGNIALGFPVYTKGFMPSGPIKKDPGKVNFDIICGGVPVKPGDLVVGDSDGVCVIPREHIEVVLQHAEEKLAYENKRNETIQKYIEAKSKGEPLPQLAPQWVLDMLEEQSAV